MVAEHRPDVVLLDHALPDGDGADAVRPLLDAHPGLHVVMLTASTSDRVLGAAMEAGAAGFISKSSGLDELVGAVRSAARGDAVVSPQLLGRLLARMRRDAQGVGHDLTEREREILGLLAKGLTNVAISEQLFLSVHTVRNHIANLSAKLGAHSKLEALAIAVREGLVEPPRSDGSRQSPAKPGSDSSRMARKGARASSWLSTPMPPSQVRWISRYDGGRLSLVATVKLGSRGLLSRSN